MSDESTADDGAAHRFWAFILLRRRRGLPEFNLDDLEQLTQAVAEFETAEANP
jgi:hypothetical protein